MLTNDRIAEALRHSEQMLTRYKSERAPGTHISPSVVEIRIYETIIEALLNIQPPGCEKRPPIHRRRIA